MKSQPKDPRAQMLKAKKRSTTLGMCKLYF